MRIGTWNMEGRWSDEHRSFLQALDCDVLLLTEVNEKIDVPGLHRGTAFMAGTWKRWAAIWSRHPTTPLPDPHPASAMVRIGEWTFCSSIIPWKGCGRVEPWIDGNHAAQTEATLATLLESLPTEGLIWGGDWNHALSGREWAGSKAGRAHLLAAVESLSLVVPTANLPHRIEGLLSIDHIAVSTGPGVSDVEHHVAAIEGRRLSDHDSYVVEAVIMECERSVSRTHAVGEDRDHE